MIFKPEEKTLIISYYFPPYTDTGGTVIAKRILEENKKVDILQNQTNTKKDETLNQILKNNINLRIILNTPTEENWKWENIKQYTQEGMNYLENISKDQKYDTIYSRSMPRHGHYLAYQYKQKHPETKWIAEFSDPIIHDIYAKERINSPLKDEEYLKEIKQNLKEKNIQIPLENTSTEYLCELLPYIFADKIIFTNKNQKETMIKLFPTKIENLEETIEKKSIIQPQPTLKEEYYHKIESNYPLNPKQVNLAYFGLFYGTRNFEDIIYSIEKQDPSLKKYYKIHIFTNETQYINQTTKNLKTNIQINKSINYLEFLNLTTKLDCLILTDAYTKDYYQKNPYLPSKLADYLGSKTDIWAITEKNSTTDENPEIKYKSQLGNYTTSQKTLEKIILEKLEKKGYKITKKQTPTETPEEIINYLQKRNMEITNTLHETLK